MLLFDDQGKEHTVSRHQDVDPGNVGLQLLTLVFLDLELQVICPGVLVIGCISAVIENTTQLSVDWVSDELPICSVSFHIGPPKDQVKWSILRRGQ